MGSEDRKSVGEQIAEDWARGLLQGTVAEAIDFEMREAKREIKALKHDLERIQAAATESMTANEELRTERDIYKAGFRELLKVHDSHLGFLHAHGIEDKLIPECVEARKLLDAEES